MLENKILDIMGFVASLDMGSGKMVMALGEKSGSDCRLVGVISIASQGVKRGKIVDKLRAKACIQRLLDRFKSEYEVHIDALNVALSGAWVKQIEDRENIKFSRPKSIDQGDLQEMEKKCRSVVGAGDEEVVDVVPFAYYVDKESEVNPVGVTAKRLDVHYHVYVARSSELRDLRDMFANLGVDKIDFYSMAGAAQKAMITAGSDICNFALLDLGADSIKVQVFQDGLVYFDEELPLGCSTIDGDINTAFSINDMEKARKLKEEFGMALRASCKNRKIMIPDTKYCIDSHDLVHVEQSRLEELLEGAIFQMQESGCYEDLDDGILLTGGGCQVAGIEVLLSKLSGHSVGFAKVASVKADREASLKSPAYFTALGLLQCERREVKKPKSGGWFSNFFKE